MEARPEIHGRILRENRRFQRLIFLRPASFILGHAHRRDNDGWCPERVAETSHSTRETHGDTLILDDADRDKPPWRLAARMRPCKAGRSSNTRPGSPRLPVDEERVREATRRKRPVEPAEFAARLKAWRKHHGLSQAQAERFLGTTGRTVWVWESERSLPNQPLAMLVKLNESPVKPKPLITPQRFGKLLRQWRKAAGINQADACKALGLPHDQALISRWERGKAMPRPARLKAILAVIAKPLPEPSPKLRFAQLLRDWRKARGLNQFSAAQALGVGRDQAKISKWERGKGLPVKPVLVRLLETLAE
jgi:transcriptional regulator with XRE-family HTH domain